MTNLDSILKSRDITLPTQVHLVKAMVFPVVMYGCEIWTIKKAWYFWSMVLGKTLESPLDCKEIQPVNTKGNSPEYSLDELMLKLKLQCFGDLMQRTDSLEKTLMLQKIESGRRRRRQRMRWLDGIPYTMDMSLNRFWELVMDREACCSQSMGSQRIGHDWVTERTTNLDLGVFHPIEKWEFQHQWFLWGGVSIADTF